MMTLEAGRMRTCLQREGSRAGQVKTQAGGPSEAYALMPILDIAALCMKAVYYAAECDCNPPGTRRRSQIALES